MNEYIEFVKQTRRKGLKTDRWEVIGSHNSLKPFLGEIRWHGAWRQYVFMPNPMTVWSSGCLDTLSEFLKGVNDDFRKSHKKGVR